jgi:hypothetical protein
VRGGWLLLAAAAISLPATWAAGQPSNPAPNLVERAGIRLPPSLCAMAQERVDTSPASIYAIYRLAGASTLRIYIERAAQSLDAEFADDERSIRNYFFEIVLARELAAPPGAPGARGRLWRGYQDTSRVATGMWLWHRAGLSIKLRGTVPLGEEERLWPEIECAVGALTAPAGATAG